MKKITLNVDGREIVFTEQELTAIVKEHLSSKTIKQETTSNVVKKTTEGEWFEVNPQTIDQKLFKKKREDNRQEATRQLILEAFDEMKKNSKYQKNFKTMIAKRDWIRKTPKELKKVASNLGDHNADWVEQALEWAQRIANGEAWECKCNDNDTANNHRLVIWKDGYAHLIGGSRHYFSDMPASYVGDYYYYDTETVDITVPLVVSY